MKLKTGLSVMALTTLLISCTQSGPETDNQYCLLTDYILIDPEEELTPETASQILAHNDTKESICS